MPNPRKTKIDLNSQRLPMRKHVRYQKVLEKQAKWAYKVVMRRTILDLKKLLSVQKLAKSDAPKLKSGWSKSASTIELDLNGRIAATVEKHLEGLRWALVGNQAGSEAISAAKQLGLVDKVTPGLLQNSYLHSIDVQREYYRRLFGEEPVHLSQDILNTSIEKIVERTNRYLDEVIVRLRNDVIKSVDRLQDFVNYTTQLDVAKEMHDLADPKKSQKAIERLAEDRKKLASKTRIEIELRQTVRNFENKWDLAVRGEIGLATAAGTHQAMTEIYAGSDDDVRVIWLTMEDNRVSDFCHSASFNPDGTYKLYKLSDLKPSGWNVGKKRDQWELCIPPAHPNCRSSLVYVPKGFRVLKGGVIVPDKKAS